MAKQRPKKLLLTLDAFGTIYIPRKPISKQYVDVACRLGLSSVDEALIHNSFATAFKTQNKKYPNYGRAIGMKTPEWWADVIHSTFKPFTSDSNPLPSRLVPELLTRFSSSEGYRLYPDVSPFFEKLRKIRQGSGSQRNEEWPWERTVVGVVTNSDDRVPLILSSLGLTVSPRRINTAWEIAPGANLDDDISFVILSYDVGAGKPDPAIFQRAKNMLAVTVADEYIQERKNVTTSDIFAPEEDFVCLHVGDSVPKDVLGARNAGFHSILLDRRKRNADAFRLSAKRIASVPVETVSRNKSSTSQQVQVIRDLRDLQYWNAEE